MDIISVLAISILLQFSAAFFALKLIPVTGKKKAWILISAAICLMAIRRCFTLYREIFNLGMGPHGVDLVTEWVSLFTSALMFAGIRYISPVFLSMKHMMDKLKLSEERYRTLFEDSNDAIFISSREGKFLDINPAAAKLFDYQKDEMIGMDVRRIYVNPSDRRGLQEEIEKSGAIRDYELLFKKRDGSQMYCTLTATLHRADDGTIQGYRGIIRDCTELKRAAELIEGERKRLYSLLNDLPGLVSLRAGDFTIPYANRAFRERLGNPEGKLCYELLYRRTSPCPKCSMLKVLKSKTMKNFECLMPDTRIYQLYHYPFTDVDGKLLVLELGIDISDRKKAEEALRESEAKFRSMAETAPCAIVIYQDDRLLYVNPGTCAITGYTQEEMLAGHFWDVIHPDFVDMVKERELARQRGGAAPHEYEYKIITKDGLEKWLLGSASFIQIEGKPACVATIFDITSHKEAENALRQSERLLREVLETLPVGVRILDKTGKITLSNAAGLEIWAGTTHFAPEHLTEYKGWWMNTGRRIEPHEWPASRAITKGETIINEEIRIECFDGSSRIILNSAIPLRNSKSEITGAIVVSQNITERWNREEERARLTTAIEQASEGIFLADTDWIIRYVNPGFERMTGYVREEILGKSADFLQENSRGPGMHERFTSIPFDGRVWKGRIRIGKKEGGFLEAETTISPVTNPLGELINYAVIQRDVTHEVELEKQLRQAQKLESLGTLAGGIAHDFNNILAIILGFLQMVMLEIPQEGRVYSRLKEVEKAAHRATDLVRQILAFSRQGEQEMRPTRIGLIVKEGLKMLRASLPSTIEIESEIATDSMVEADPTQIHQVLINLCTNAAHAMRETGGHLRVSLEDVYLDHDFVLEHPDTVPGEYLKLAVSDTGQGMDASVMQRIFDPYFTTKEVGEGTGLGLAVVHGIVKNHGGTITVSSQPGSGTTFNVYFPRTEKEENPETTFLPALQGGNESILFVDDEKALCETAQQMLEQLGYRVFIKMSPTEALKDFRSNPDQFDLVLTDLTMPKLTGLELASEILRLRPDMPIILCTGFSDIITQEKARSFGIRELLIKPVTPSELAATVRRILDEKLSS